MAQTRRIGKHNEKAYLLSAPRFSRYRNGQITELFVHSPFPRVLKLTRVGGCRTATEDNAGNANTPRWGARGGNDPD